MKDKILQRVEELLNPQLSILIENLKDKEVEYFIEHLTLDMSRSIHNWYKKSAKNR